MPRRLCAVPERETHLWTNDMPPSQRTIVGFTVSKEEVERAPAHEPVRPRAHLSGW